MSDSKNPTKTCVVWRANSLSPSLSKADVDSVKKCLESIAQSLEEVQLPVAFDSKLYCNLLNKQAIGKAQGELATEIDTSLVGPLRKDGYPAWTAILVVHGGEPQVFDSRVMCPNRLASQLFNLMDLRGDILVLPSDPSDHLAEEESSEIKKEKPQEQEHLTKVKFLEWATQQLKDMEKELKSSKKKPGFDVDKFAGTVITVGPKPICDEDGNSVSCEKCDGAAVYPIVQVGGFLQLKFKLCVVHHPKYAKTWRASQS